MPDSALASHAPVATTVSRATMLRKISASASNMRSATPFPLIVVVFDPVVVPALLCVCIVSGFDKMSRKSNLSSPPFSLLSCSNVLICVWILLMGSLSWGAASTAQCVMQRHKSRAIILY